MLFTGILQSFPNTLFPSDKGKNNDKKINILIVWPQR